MYAIPLLQASTNISSIVGSTGEVVSTVNSTMMLLTSIKPPWGTSNFTLFKAPDPGGYVNCKVEKVKGTNYFAAKQI